MEILLISAHAGGGVGSVLMDWVDTDIANRYTVALLDYANEKIGKWGESRPRTVYEKMVQYPHILDEMIVSADIVVLNYWDHPLLSDFISRKIPPCRMVSWLHKNCFVTPREISYPDIFLDTSPIQNHGRFIWSARNMASFLAVQPKKHDGFIIGTIASPKLHPEFIPMCLEIKERIPEAHFTILGDFKDAWGCADTFTFAGKVDDVIPFMETFDVFGYPLRADHTGTCEQALGEAMCAGVVPVVMDNPCENKIITNEFNGLIVSSAEDYCRYVSRLADNRDRRSFVEITRYTAKKLYSIDTMISQWNDTFEDLMKREKKGRGK